MLLLLALLLVLLIPLPLKVSSLSTAAENVFFGGGGRVNHPSLARWGWRRASDEEHHQQHALAWTTSYHGNMGQGTATGGGEERDAKADAEADGEVQRLPARAMMARLLERLQCSVVGTWAHYCTTAGDVAGIADFQQADFAGCCSAIAACILQGLLEGTVIGRKIRESLGRRSRPGVEGAGRRARSRRGALLMLVIFASTWRYQQQRGRRFVVLSSLSYLCNVVSPSPYFSR